MPSLTWVEVDLAAIQHNVHELKRLTTAQLMAMVKANAYGHGAVRVSQAVAAAGGDWLGVARVEEGLALRAAGIGLPILVLGYTPPAQAAAAAAQRLALMVAEVETAQAYAAQVAQPLAVHLKVDTGMGRLGALPAEAVGVLRTLSNLPSLRVEGLYTHFAGSDLANRSATEQQLATFNEVLAACKAAGLRPPVVHASNSAAIFSLPAAHFDVVRAGIALYGLNPSEAVPCPPTLRPALTWKSQVVAVKTLPPGHGVSYGPEYVTTTTERLAVVAVGYGDGFRRVPKNVNQVLIHGQVASVRGRVCMDNVVVGINHLPQVQVGDEVVIVGPGMTADEVAARWGTINYDVTTGIAARVERVYVDE